MRRMTWILRLNVLSFNYFAHGLPIAGTEKRSFHGQSSSEVKKRQWLSANENGVDYLADVPPPCGDNFRMVGDNTVTIGGSCPGNSENTPVQPSNPQPAVTPPTSQENPPEQLPNSMVDGVLNIPTRGSPIPNTLRPSIPDLPTPDVNTPNWVVPEPPTIPRLSPGTRILPKQDMTPIVPTFPSANFPSTSPIITVPPPGLRKPVPAYPSIDQDEVDHLPDRITPKPPRQRKT